MERPGYLRMAAFAAALVLASCGGRDDRVETAVPASHAAGPAAGEPASVTGARVTGRVPFARGRLDAIRPEAPAARGGAAPRAVPFPALPPPQAIPAPPPTPPLPAPSSTGSLPHAAAPRPSALQVEAPAPHAPDLSRSFQGLLDPGVADPMATVIPPDTMGAAGPSHLVSVLNSGFGIFDKATGSKLTEISLQAFWADLGTGPGQPAAMPVFDPKVLYDQHSGRFVAVSVGGHGAPSSWLLVAVSETSDPRGDWYRWAIDADLDNNAQLSYHWADYPCPGLDNACLYVAANMFSNGGTFQYAKLWVIPKPQLLAGSNPISWTEFRDPPGSWAVLQPAHTFGNAPAEYVVHASKYYLTGPRRLLKVAAVTLLDADTSVWTDLGFIEVAGYPVAALPDAPQLGSTNRIETNDTRLLNAVYRNGHLWMAHTVSDNTNSRTEAAWYQIDPGRAGPLAAPGIPVQQGRITDPSRCYYFPSIAVNANGDAAAGFSGSSTAEYAGAWYTARAASDTAGTMRPPALLKEGFGPYYKSINGSTNRWGDYSATCVDPDGDLAFWTVQEIAGAPDNTWATWWGSFALPFSGLPAAPASLSAAPASESAVDLSWTDLASDETGFAIERKEGASGSFIEIDTVTADTATFRDFGLDLDEDTVYAYRVRAYNASGSSGYSNEVSARTCLAAPGDLSAEAVSPTQVRLTWTDRSQRESGYEIARKTNAEESYAFVAATEANATVFTDGSLSGGTTYRYRIRAYNASGNHSLYSYETEATTPQGATPVPSGGGGGCAASGARTAGGASPASGLLLLVLTAALLVLRRAGIRGLGRNRAGSGRDPAPSLLYKRKTPEVSE